MYRHGQWKWPLIIIIDVYILLKKTLYETFEPETTASGADVYFRFMYMFAIFDFCSSSFFGVAHRLLTGSDNG